MESQRHALTSSDIRLEVQLDQNLSLLAEIEIRSTMKDQKLLQEESGLGLSNYPCTLCLASKNEIRDPENIIRGFPINRTNELLHNAGHLARLNPANLNRAQLGEVLKGSKSVPLTLGDAPMVRNAFESLHFKLSIARWLVKILARVNAKMYIWAIDKNLKPSFQPFEDDLTNKMTKVLGLQKRLQIQVSLWSLVFD